MRTAVPNKLCPELWHLNEHLGNAATHLWEVSEGIHNRQNQKGDPNEYGRIHVEFVEYNIWRLLFDPQNPAEVVEENKKYAKARPYEIFLLSAAACCHDFDKADKLPKGVQHGAHSGEIVRKNRNYFGLNDNQVEDIEAIISVHGIHDVNKFKDALRKLPTEKPYEHGTVNLRRVALLLKAADCLHLDRSRISESMKNTIDWDRADKDIKRKCFLRSNSRGWGIRGKVLRIEVSIETKEQNKFRRYFDWFRKNEWSAVSELLEAWGFPYELDLDFGDASDFQTQQGGRQYKYISMKAKRYISDNHARQFLCSALKQGSKYPICRNGYTTHAVGVTATRISLLSLGEKMGSFKIDFDTTVHEFILETECILSKLCEHFTRFSNTRYLFKQLVENDALSGSFKNSLQDAIKALPTGKSFYKHLSIFRREFESNLEDMRKRITPRLSEVEAMTDIEQRKAFESAKWLLEKNPEVREWFAQKKKHFLEVALNLEKAVQALNLMLAPVQDDWDKDYSLIQRQEQGMHKVSSLSVSQT